MFMRVRAHRFHFVQYSCRSELGRRNACVSQCSCGSERYANFGVGARRADGRGERERGAGGGRTRERLGFVGPNDSSRVATIIDSELFLPGEEVVRRTSVKSFPLDNWCVGAY